jgi:hypothetical protein
MCGPYGRVFTEVADPSLLDANEDTSLIIYNAMSEESFDGDNYLSAVSNGAQTDDVMIHQGSRTRQLLENMKSWTYEPDGPNFTPRITATSTWMQYEKGDRPLCQISVLRKSPWSDACDRLLYEFDGVAPGFGYCVHTYMGDGNPLPPFRGEPYLLPLVGDARSILNEYWQTLNAPNLVALAVKFIPKTGPSEIVIRNEYTELG